MPQCKRDGCRAQALPYGKRYCPTHKAEYIAKQKAYEERRASLPDCVTCGGKVNQNRAESGHRDCYDCATRKEAAEAQQAEFDRLDGLRADRLQTLQNCRDIEEIKSFLARHVLPHLPVED